MIRIKKLLVRLEQAVSGGSIGRRISLLFLCMIVFFMVFSGINQKFLYEFSTYYKNVNELNETARELEWNVQRSNTAFQQFLRSGNEVYADDYQETITRISNQISTIEQQSSYEELQYLIPGIKNLLKAYYANCEQAINDYRNKDYGYFNYMRESQMIEKYLDEYCSQMIEIIAENSSEEYYDWEARRQNWIEVNIGFIMWMLVLALFIIGFISVSITKPMRVLADAARRVSEGDFKAEVPNGTDDNEITLFGRVFNQMVKNIQRMLESEKEKAATEKELLLAQQKNEEYKMLLEQSRFLALQAQINPHFLFNTLNSIKSTVMLGKNREALSMLNAFAAFMRYNLQDADSQVFLEDELKITREYLRIQQIRFADRIQMHIDYDEDILQEVKIPRFTLQPLAENAMMHGLEKKMETGDLRISIKNRKKYIAVRIFDNGLGMSEERLLQIRTGQYVGEKRVGISNIRKRLEIFYGRSDIFHMASMEGRGTLVVLKIPMEERCV